RGEQRQRRHVVPQLAALAPDVVVHLGTTSKILTPMLGVGWMAAPAPVAAAVCAHRSAAGVQPAPAGQRVFAEFAASGDLSRHLRRVRRELLARRDLLVDALGTTGLPVSGEQAGAHLVVRLPSAQHEQCVVHQAPRRGLLLDGLARCHIAGSGRHGVTVGYAALSSRALLAAMLPRLTDLLMVHPGEAGRRG
ncbi:MAG TPA: aminotransferase class I/II-fold pyridoxal phosphate-dependent enzyme, partial [Pseudonocardiaceae bacterium]|nr:aminotransferase class I/II-fold pyridoxal phosphate-dependent enzyme [Pseudonocardiaceae bacterium]